jgi:hypothetical protein
MRDEQSAENRQHEWGNVMSDKVSNLKALRAMWEQAIADTQRKLDRLMLMKNSKQQLLDGNGNDVLDSKINLLRDALDSFARAKTMTEALEADEGI